MVTRYIVDVLMALHAISVESTAFATCLLSVTRCICLSHGFYKINTRFISYSVGAFLAYISMREGLFVAALWSAHPHISLFSNIRYYVYLTYLSTIVFLVIPSNIISIRHVVLSEGSDDLMLVARHAALTVLMVSVNFCTLNTFFILCSGYFNGVPRIMENGSPGLIFLEYFNFRVVIPLNSATNPLVYLHRKKAMRQFAWKTLARIYSKRQSVSDYFARLNDSVNGAGGFKRSATMRKLISTRKMVVAQPPDEKDRHDVLNMTTLLYHHEFQNSSQNSGQSNNNVPRRERDRELEPVIESEHRSMKWDEDHV